MLYNNFTEELLGLQGVKIINIENNEDNQIIYAEMERKKHNCICCGTATDTVHDYRTQRIKDISGLNPCLLKDLIILQMKKNNR